MRNCSSARQMNHSWPLSFEENYVWLGSGFGVEKALTRLRFNYGVIKWVRFGAQTDEKKEENHICFVVVNFNSGKQIWFYGLGG
jgi:hypothetical protein